MLVQSILREIEPIKGFVFERTCWGKESETRSLEITVRARKGSRPICSVCSKPGPGYDTLPARRFLYPPPPSHPSPQSHPSHRQTPHRAQPSDKKPTPQP